MANHCEELRASELDYLVHTHIMVRSYMACLFNHHVCICTERCWRRLLGVSQFSLRSSNF